MKETISEQIYEFLTIGRYLAIMSFFSILLGLVLFVYSIILNISIINIPSTSSPLFFIMLGICILCFRYFIIITDKKEECE
jgi:hypothetical protein